MHPNKKQTPSSPLLPLTKGTAPKVVQGNMGKWLVVSAEGETISEHETNSAAWRSLDRLCNEPINRREEVADWAFRQMANRGRT